MRRFLGPLHTRRTSIRGIYSDIFDTADKVMTLYCNLSAPLLVPGISIPVPVIRTLAFGLCNINTGKSKAKLIIMIISEFYRF